MLNSARLIIMSHLSDVQELSNDRRINGRINFAKYLISKYSKNLMVEIDPEADYEEFNKKFPKSGIQENKQMKLNKEDQIKARIIKEKLEKLSGKKVVFKESQKELDKKRKALKIKILKEKIEKMSGKKVVFKEDVEMTQDQVIKEPDVVEKLNDKQIDVKLEDDTN